MKNLLYSLVLGVLACGTLVTDDEFPRGENFVRVLAIGDGLCVSNSFQSNMALQRGKPLAVWGWATAGDEVTVSFAGQESATKAGADRAWRVMLGAEAAIAELKPIL